MLERIGEHFDYYKFPVGARVYALRQMKSNPLVKQEADVESEIDAAIDVNEVASERNFDWRQLKKKESFARSGAREVDQMLDRAVSDTYRLVDAQASLQGGSQESELAAELEEDLFPQGVAPITSLPYVEQHEAVNRLLERLAIHYQDHVSRLNLRAHIDRVGELNDEYGELLDTTDAEGLTYDEVREARKKGEDAFYRALIAVYAAFMHDMDKLRDVLEPVEIQNERLRRHYQRRDTSPDVDPESGEVIESEEGDDREDVDEPVAT